MTINQIHKKLSGKEISCKELVEGFLGTIKKKAKEIHAYLEVASARALKQAK